MCSILIWLNFDLTLTWISAMLVFSSCQLTQYTVDLWLPSSGDISETGRSFIELHRPLLLGSVHLTCTSTSHFVHTSPRHFSHRQIENGIKCWIKTGWKNCSAVSCCYSREDRTMVPEQPVSSAVLHESRCLCFRLPTVSQGCPCTVPRAACVKHHKCLS